MEKNTKFILIVMLFVVILIGYLVFRTVNKPVIVDVKTGVNPFRGDLSSQNVIVEFSDYECPACGASEPIIEDIVNNYNVALYYRNFPLTSIHPFAYGAALASECANEQDKFWGYHDILFSNQEALKIDDLKSYAEDLGLDQKEFNLCLDNQKYSDIVQSDYNYGKSIGVSATPTFFVNGNKVVGGDRSKIISYLK